MDLYVSDEFCLFPDLAAALQPRRDGGDGVAAVAAHTPGEWRDTPLLAEDPMLRYAGFRGLRAAAAHAIDAAPADATRAHITVESGIKMLQEAELREARYYYGVGGVGSSSSSSSDNRRVDEITLAERLAAQCAQHDKAPFHVCFFCGEHFRDATNFNTQCTVFHPGEYSGKRSAFVCCGDARHVLGCTRTDHIVWRENGSHLRLREHWLQRPLERLPLAWRARVDSRAPVVEDAGAGIGYAVATRARGPTVPSPERV